MHTKKTAFTLIELLVTIVIIGVLSAISVSSFNGFQEKARNAVKIQYVSDYKTALDLYKTLNNGLMPSPIRPDSAGDVADSWICLGDYEDDRCWAYGGSGNFTGSQEENATFNQEMDRFIGPGLRNTFVHETLTPSVTGDHELSGVGLVYNPTSTLDGAPIPHWTITYALEGEETDCGFPALAFDVANSNVRSTNNPDPYSITGQGGVRCLILYDINI